MPFDRFVSDLNWKIAHGVLYTAERLSSFGYDMSVSCFCGCPSESAEHLFFDCPEWHFVDPVLVDQVIPFGPSRSAPHSFFLL